MGVHTVVDFKSNMAVVAHLLLSECICEIVGVTSDVSNLACVGCGEELSESTIDLCATEVGNEPCGKCTGYGKGVSRCDGNRKSASNSRKLSRGELHWYTVECAGVPVNEKTCEHVGW